MADRLTLAHALEEGGIPRDAAEHIATEILDAIQQNVATKSDLAGLRGELKADIASLRAELKADIASLRAELKADIAEVKADITSVRGELSLIEHRLLTRIGGMIVAATGILVAIHYIH